MWTEAESYFIVLSLDTSMFVGFFRNVSFVTFTFLTKLFAEVRPPAVPELVIQFQK